MKENFKRAAAATRPHWLKSISFWDLKKGFVKAAQFKNNHAVGDGIVEVLDRENKATYRAPSINPCVDGGCDDGGGTTVTGGQLREVIIPPTPKKQPTPNPKVV
jgi:hypothetical protein